MASIFQKNRTPETNLKLPSEQALESKDDLLSKSTFSKASSLGDLKFPSEEAKLTKVENLEKSLNDAGGTAIKIGLKGVVALNKAQQILEDRSSQRSLRMQSNSSKPEQSLDPLVNLLALLEMVKSSKLVKRIARFFSRRGKQNTKSKLPEPQPIRPQPKKK